MVDDALIELRRRSGSWGDSLRAYKIRLEKESVGSIAEGESKTIATSGRHELYLRIDYCRSQVLSVEVKSGETVCLECWLIARI